MNCKSTSLFLAVVLSAAAPAFADKIPVELRQTDGVFGFTQESIHGTAAAFDSKRTKIDAVGMLAYEHLTANNAAVELIDLHAISGNEFGKDSDKNWWKHKGKKSKGGDGALSVVAAQEPGSQILLLFGLAGLGILFHRRGSVKQTI